MINILINQKPGLTDSVSCPTMEILSDHSFDNGDWLFVVVVFFFRFRFGAKHYTLHASILKYATLRGCFVKVFTSIPE